MVSAYTCVVDGLKVKRLIVPVTMICSVLLISGCAINGNSIDTGIPSTAASIADTTPSIAADPFSGQVEQKDAGSTDRILDEDTIRLAVTTADLSRLNADGLPWANQATGSSGIISNIEQRVEAGQTCRSFNATRNAYDGAMLYEGDVCLDKGSGWWTRILHPFGEKNT